MFLFTFFALKPFIIAVAPKYKTNPRIGITKQKKIIFRHPILNENYTKAKKEIDSIQGIKGTYFVGAWL